MIICLTYQSTDATQPGERDIGQNGVDDRPFRLGSCLTLTLVRAKHSLARFYRGGSSALLEAGSLAQYRNPEWSIKMEDDTLFRCRVCGLLQLDQPWGESGKDPTFFICKCCGTEFGIEDCLPKGARRAREEWLAKGAPWFKPHLKPDDWDLEEQLKHIPEEFR